jgi:hypothetical protein
VKNVHRAARMCLDPPEVKAHLRAFATKRKEATKRRMWFDAFYSIFHYFEQFGLSDPTGRLFGNLLPNLVTPENIRMIEYPEAIPGQASQVSSPIARNEKQE